MAGLDLTPPLKKQRFEKQEERSSTSFAVVKSGLEQLPESLHTNIWSYLTQKERSKTVRTSHWSASFFSKNKEYLNKSLDKENCIYRAGKSARLLSQLIMATNEEARRYIEADSKQLPNADEEGMNALLKDQVFISPGIFFQECMMEYLLKGVQLNDIDEEIFDGMICPFLELPLLALLLKFNQQHALQYLLAERRLENIYYELYSTEDALEALKESSVHSLLLSLNSNGLSLSRLLPYIKLMDLSLIFNQSAFYRHLINLCKEKFNIIFVAPVVQEVEESGPQVVGMLGL